MVAGEHEFVAFGFDDGHVSSGGDEFQLGGLEEQFGGGRQGAETVAQFVFKVAQGGGVGGLGQFAVDVNAMPGFGDVGDGEGGGRRLRIRRIRLPIADCGLEFAASGFSIQVATSRGTWMSGAGWPRGIGTSGRAGEFFAGVGEEIQAKLHFEAGFGLLAFEVADALFEELAVKLKADGGDVAALFGAEQVAGAADFQVAHGDAEAAAQGGILFDGAEALAGLHQQAGMAGQQQVGVGLVLVTAHPAAQLIEIAQAEAVGAVNDDGVGVGDVQAAFDDGGGQQDVGAAVDEVGHDFLQFAGVHLAVADGEAGLGNQRAQTSVPQPRCPKRGCASKKPGRRG